MPPVWSSCELDEAFPVASSCCLVSGFLQNQGDKSVSWFGLHAPLSQTSVEVATCLKKCCSMLFSVGTVLILILLLLSFGGKAIVFATVRGPNSVDC